MPEESKARYFYPPVLFTGEVLDLMVKGSLANGGATYVYGVLVRETAKDVWQVGNREGLTPKGAVHAVQEWLAAGREEVKEDDPRLVRK